MKVEMLKDGLIVTPETDFEIQWLRRFYHPQGVTGFLKHGVSISTVVGLKVLFPPDVCVPVELEEDDEDENN